MTDQSVDPAAPADWLLLHDLAAMERIKTFVVPTCLHNASNAV
jgi:hypothetical protein